MSTVSCGNWASRGPSRWFEISQPSPPDLSVDKSGRACLPPAGAFPRPPRQPRPDYKCTAQPENPLASGLRLQPIGPGDVPLARPLPVLSRPRCSYKTPTQTLHEPDGIPTSLNAWDPPRTPSQAQKPAPFRTHGPQAANPAGGQQKFPPSTGYPQGKSTGYPPEIFMLHCYFLARLSPGARTFPYRNGSQDTGRGAKASATRGW